MPFCREYLTMLCKDCRKCYDTSLDLCPQCANAGELNPNAKLTAGLVREIRQLLRDGVSCAKIAKMYDVSRMTISNISRERTWKP